MISNRPRNPAPPPALSAAFANITPPVTPGTGGTIGQPLGGGTPVLNPATYNQPIGMADGGMVPMQGQMQAPQPMQPQPQMGPQLGVPGASAPGQVMTYEQITAEVNRVLGSNPQIVQQIQQSIQQILSSGELTVEDLNMAVQMATAAAQNPALYPRLRQMAIERGFASEQELPQSYDSGVILMLMLIGEVMKRGGATAQPQQPQQPTGPVPARPGGPMPQAQAPGMADGGYMPMHASPTGDNTGRADDIPVMMSGGEYIIPKHVVERKGTEFFDKLVGKDIKAG